MRRIIKTLQIIFFSLFLFTLILPYVNANLAHLSFIKLGIFAYIFSFKFNILFLILIILIILQFFFGRIFCSFICPMGNLTVFFDNSFRHFRKKKINYKKLTFIPAGILLLIIIFRFLHLNIIGFFDPLSIIHRFFTLAFIPILDSFLRPASSTASFFTVPGFILLLIILLSFTGQRVWCRFICPLGIIHRLISLPAGYIRIVEKCSSCEKCAGICPANAIDIEDPLKYDKSQCLLCFKCMDTCPEKITFKFLKNKKNIKKTSNSRRRFLKSIFSTAVLFNFTLKQQQGNSKAPLLVPPGATARSIQDNCIRCMECVKVCPTKVIRPTGLSFGLAELFFPQIMTDIGYCDYHCNLCGRVCPTNSIKNLPLKKKQKWPIGKAEIFHRKCIVWRKGTPCTVCRDVCPVPEKAVKFKKYKLFNKILQTPVVDADLCNGCGICQIKCPVKGSAIIVKGILKNY